MWWTSANTCTCRALPQGRLPLDIMLKLRSLRRLRAVWFRPRHSPKITRGVRARLHHADDLHLLGGRKVRHHRRLLDTRENRAFLEDGQPSHLPKPSAIATKAEQLAWRISDHGGTANDTVHNLQMNPQHAEFRQSFRQSPFPWDRRKRWTTC